MNIYSKAKFYLKNKISRAIGNYFVRVFHGCKCHLIFSRSQNGEAEGKRAEGAIASKVASAESVGCLSHSAKQSSVFKHSNKKLNYFLIEFLLQ